MPVYQFSFTSRFRSDCIENLFSSVCTNIVFPYPLEVLKKTASSPDKSSSNYENDDSVILLNLYHVAALQIQKMMMIGHKSYVLQTSVRYQMQILPRRTSWQDAKSRVF